MKTYYFAYGANTNIRCMEQRCPEAVWSGTATLPGYALRFRVHADIEPSDKDNVLGVLWYIDEDVLKSLDHFEGFPHYYTRFEAEVWQDGEPIRALVYMMTDQTFEDKPSKDYLQRCIEGYEDNNVPTLQLFEALDNLKRNPQWDPVFERIKKTPQREFKEAILKNEYYDLDD